MTKCENCGTELPPDAPSGLCPGCLLQTALEQTSSDLRCIGDYELLTEIARGGMGIVYKARQVSLDRIVALKMMRPGLLSTEAEIARFRAEAASAAGLRHPAIVAVHEIGEQDGLYYYSMDLIEGESLAARIPLSSNDAAHCLNKVAEAVAFAHSRGILHRDLKPSNILIDADGEPHIADFGVVIGTPGYMPPEKERTEASDIYSLGAILRDSNPHLSSDLGSIASKCLESNPRERYTTAAQLAADLSRFLRGEPVLSRQAGISERVWKWCRRNPWPTAAAAALAIAAGVSTASALALRTRLADSYLKQSALQRLTLDRTGAINQWREAAKIEVTPAVRDAAMELSIMPGLRQFADLPVGSVYGRGFSADSKTIDIRGTFLGGPHKMEGGVIKTWLIESKAWGKTVKDPLANCPDPEVSTPPPAGLSLEKEARILAGNAAYSPDGAMYAATVAQGTKYGVHVWDTVTGDPIAEIPESHSPLWSPNGLLLATTGGRFVEFADGPGRHFSRSSVITIAGLTVSNAYLTIWEVTAPTPAVHALKPIHFLSFSPDDKHLAANGALWEVRGSTAKSAPSTLSGDYAVYDRNAQLFDVQYEPALQISGARRIDLHNADYSAMHFVPDGPITFTSTGRKMTASGVRIKTLEVLINSAGDRAVMRGAPVTVYPGGTYGGRNSSTEFVELWDLLKGVRVAFLTMPDSRCGAGQIAFSPDGARIAIYGSTGARPEHIFLWDSATGKPVGDVKIPLGEISQSAPVVFSPDGNTLYIGFSSYVSVLDLRTGHEKRFLFQKPSQPSTSSLAISPDGQIVAAGESEGMIRLWRAKDGAALGEWESRKAAITALAFSHSGEALAAGAEDASLRIWNLRSIRSELSKLGMGW